ncbi:hypothetical protein [Mucilaginibacter jinjuensis]|uniref:Uncharacterized protein n=1 Tax=Mucilaginibacter jinjuensis TaxID=1176721 RepID=A0ABY7TD29_9SPHI|nr:hypothetical protein [Mucilaginibacter jinjuensis]WCT14064.1 hypothetical protein PQO05_08965 [Mucilaginibacter jinjuensis]
MKNKRAILWVVIIIALLLVLWNVFTQPGPADLKGNFKEVAFTRNEQNTGPVIRVYAVTVSDTLWKEMIDYGNFMPYNKYGNTKVYFFLNRNPYPKQLTIGNINFDSRFNNYCIGLYQKDVMSQVNLKKLPFAAEKNK